ncbi:rRNA pseudouridine synthase [Patescibacteria group bacterium]|nr:rRNA pseudouridine synthase [Patescibacteria group bacterium]
MRLQKYLAMCGVASRRRAEELILDGRVEVNGVVADVLGTKVDEEVDEVFLDGEVVRFERKVYYMLNKPAGYICSLSDYHAEKLVSELIPVDLRIFPVGRLDKDTEGLLIMTNDGDFANNVIHPAKKIAKEYEVHLTSPLTSEEIQKLKKGCLLDDVTVSMADILPQEKNIYNIVIYQGRKRQIRRMFEQMYINVVYLKRIRIGDLKLGDLEVGEYRELKEEEINLF